MKPENGKANIELTMGATMQPEPTEDAKRVLRTGAGEQPDAVSLRNTLAHSSINIFLVNDLACASIVTAHDAIEKSIYARDRRVVVLNKKMHEARKAYEAGIKRGFAHQEYETEREPETLQYMFMDLCDDYESRNIKDIRKLTETIEKALEHNKEVHDPKTIAKLETARLLTYTACELFDSYQQQMQPYRHNDDRIPFLKGVKLTLLNSAVKTLSEYIEETALGCRWNDRMRAETVASFEQGSSTDMFKKHQLLLFLQSIYHPELEPEAKKKADRRQLTNDRFWGIARDTESTKKRQHDLRTIWIAFDAVKRGFIDSKKINDTTESVDSMYNDEAEEEKQREIQQAEEAVKAERAAIIQQCIEEAHNTTNTESNE